MAIIYNLKAEKLRVGGEDIIPAKWMFFRLSLNLDDKGRFKSGTAEVVNRFSGAIHQYSEIGTKLHLKENEIKDIKQRIGIDVWVCNSEGSILRKQPKFKDDGNQTKQETRKPTSQRLAPATGIRKKAKPRQEIQGDLFG